DLGEDRTHDGRKYRMLNVLDEFSHECLAIRVARTGFPVIDVTRARDGHIRKGCPYLSGLPWLNRQPLEAALAGGAFAGLLEPAIGLMGNRVAGDRVEQGLRP